MAKHLNRSEIKTITNIILAVAIVVKLTNIQWVEGAHYRKLAKERTVKNFVIPANKCNIVTGKQIGRAHV